MLAGDAAFALDRLSELARSDPHDRFTGRLDTGRVAIVGHSRGGSTVARACSADDRVDACVTFDNIDPDREVESGLPGRSSRCAVGGPASAKRGFTTSWRATRRSGALPVPRRLRLQRDGRPAFRGRRGGASDRPGSVLRRAGVEQQLKIEVAVLPD